MIGRTDQLAAALRDRLDGHGLTLDDVAPDVRALLDWIDRARFLPALAACRALDAALTRHDCDDVSTVITGWIVEESVATIVDRLRAARQLLDQ